MRVATNGQGLVIGLRAFMQWRFQAGSRSVKAVRAVDTATHPDYRRAGMFTTLSRQVAEQAAQDGVDLIFNTPNQRSLPGYLKLGWCHVGTVRPMVSILNAPRLVFGLVRNGLGFRKSESHSPEEFFSQPVIDIRSLLNSAQDGLEHLLLESGGLCGANDSIITSRSIEYLRWRYAEHPFLNYWVATRSSDGRLKGCVIFRTNTRFGLKEVMLCELLLAERDEGLCRSLLSQLRSCLQADYLLAYFQEGSFLQCVLKRCGFRSVPRYGMNFTVNPLTADLPVDPLRFDSWALTVGDLELF